MSDDCIELGWIAGRTVAIEYRWAGGQRERFTQIAGEFTRLNVDVIVTAGGAVPAVKQTTSVIPIVFVLANDPLGGGLVASLSRPSGNVTGLSAQGSDLAGKRLALLREMRPNLRRLAVLANTGLSESRLELEEVQAAARTLGLELATLAIQQADEIASAFEMLKGGADALYVVVDGLIASNRIRINTFALTARLPTIYNIREYVEVGGLMSYGPNFRDLFRRAADLVDKILRGAKPSDIPVEQPTKFDLVINLSTARALGLEIPPMLLARADEVIE